MLYLAIELLISGKLLLQGCCTPTPRVEPEKGSNMAHHGALEMLRWYLEKYFQDEAKKQ
jgi:hypothetical protein